GFAAHEVSAGPADVASHPADRLRIARLLQIHLEDDLAHRTLPCCRGERRLARIIPGEAALPSSGADRLLVGLSPFGFLAQRFLADAVDREIRGFEDFPDFDFLAIAEGDAPGPGQRLVFRLDVDDPEAGDQFLTFGEGSVGDADLAGAVEFYAEAVGARLEAVGREQDTGGDELIVVTTHFGKLFGTRQHAGFGIGVGLDNHHETHVSLLVLSSCSRRRSRGFRPRYP